MKNKNLKITVSGENGTGKSTLIYLLKEFLKQNNFNIELMNSVDFKTETEFDNIIGKNIEEKSDLIKYSNILIEENQINKEIFYENI